jgi:hypothetical protein
VTFDKSGIGVPLLGIADWRRVSFDVTGLCESYKDLSQIFQPVGIHIIAHHPRILLFTIFLRGELSRRRMKIAKVGDTADEMRLEIAS